MPTRENAISQETMVKRYRDLYSKFGSQLTDVKLRAASCSAKGQSSDMELELSYLRIRDTQPNLVTF